MRTGITTGTCAAAAAKAAAMVLAGLPAPLAVDVTLPGGNSISVPLTFTRLGDNRASAGVRKDAGDDPDVTDGLEVIATVWWARGTGVRGTGVPPVEENHGQVEDSPRHGECSTWRDGHAAVTFSAGDGVGTVTKPGLQVAVGEPAINPVPRRMIAQAVRQVSDRAVCVEISIPGGREAAARTFNPRLGVVGGLSILGTTGIVRPYCTKALHDALRCTLDVAAACGVRSPVLVPGNIGAKAARRHFQLSDEQLIEIGNEWGFVLDEIGKRGEPPAPETTKATTDSTDCTDSDSSENNLSNSFSVRGIRAIRGVGRAGFQALMLLGHPGKLAKLADGQWDTHSSRSTSATGIVARLIAEVLGVPPPACPTVEGMFAALPPDGRQRVGDELARRIGAAVGRGVVQGTLTPALSQREREKKDAALSQGEREKKDATLSQGEREEEELPLSPWERVAFRPGEGGQEWPLRPADERGVAPRTLTSPRRLCDPALSQGEREKEKTALSRSTSLAADQGEREKQGLPVSVFLVNMAGECIGRHGDFSRWQARANPS